MELVTNGGSLKGTLTVPGDKSISHRSIMFGALAEGVTKVHGFLRAEDCLGTLAMYQKLGVDIQDQEGVLVITGRGLNGLQAPTSPIDIGNSGTTIRLSLGVLAGTDFTTTMFGDDSIAKRPMNRVMNPLREMGVVVVGNDHSEFPPLTIQGAAGHLHPIRYEMPVASAQVKSAILLAALQTAGETVVIEKEATRNHTEEMIEWFGGAITVNGNEIRVRGQQPLTGQTITVPSDISSAAFFLVAAAILPGSDLTLENVGLHETRTGILDVLREMGATISVSVTDSKQHIGSIRIQGSQLKGMTIGGAIIPRLIDELPIIALLATQAVGQTIIKDAEELKVKETNRIDAVATELQKMGAKIVATEDGLIIEGEQTLHGAQVTSYGDHRIGMMLQIAALLVQDGRVSLERGEAVAVSYPQFFNDLATVLHAK